MELIAFLGEFNWVLGIVAVFCFFSWVLSRQVAKFEAKLDSLNSDIKMLHDKIEIYQQSNRAEHDMMISRQNDLEKLIEAREDKIFSKINALSEGLSYIKGKTQKGDD